MKMSFDSLKPCKKKNQGGFTLMEVLISFAILSVLLVGILQSQGDMMVILQRTKKIAVAENYVKRQLLRAERNYARESVGINEGLIEEPQELNGVRWEKEVTDEKYFQTDLRKVTYRVFWKDGAKTRKYENFIIIQPVK